MAIKLTIRDKRNIEDEYSRTFVQHKVTLGRARHCDICLPDLSVSTCHLEIRLVQNDFCAVDMASLNGTFLGKKKLIAHRPKKLSNDVLLTVANFEIRFQLGVSLGPIQDRNIGQNQALNMLGSVLAMAPVDINPALVVISGPGKASRFELEPAPSLAYVGRSRQVEIRLDDNDVSRKHAQVVYENGEITISDLGSRNGVLHNGVLEKSFALTQGSSFTLGNTTLALEHPLDPSLHKIQGAPEDETASFCTTPPKEVPIPESPPEVPDDEPVSPEEETPQLPTGPMDPLLSNDTTDYIKTQEMPVPHGEEKSDFGLIVVGVIVVVGCVSALIWLLT